MARLSKIQERAPRKGEELDLLQLHTWLNDTMPELKGTPKVTQFSGGASNWTYRLQYDDRTIILRRAPLGKKAAGAHDMTREFHLQRRLKRFYPYVPKVLALCEDESVLGSGFYLMEELTGIIPRKNFPTSTQSWSSETIRRLCYSFWDKLIELHQVDITQGGLELLGKGKGYVERQISGWNRRYADAKTWNVPGGHRVMRWLENNVPPDEHLCLIHNDFRLDNVVFDPKDPAHIRGVLDWELAAIGDPLMDLGGSLAYWVEADDDFFIKSMRRQPSHVPGMLTRQQVIDYYASQTGREIGDFRFYRVYGLFRLAGIAQQIYYRYAKGQTRNPAFKNFWMVSNYLIYTCLRILKRKH